MKEKHENELFQTAHSVILICYTFFSLALVAVSFMMGWEVWATIIVVAALAATWVLHIGQMVPANIRLWIHALLMMGTFFYYGIHLTSTFDMVALMAGIIIIFTMTGKPALINLCMVTYFATLAYDVLEMIRQDYFFDKLLISRIALHVFVIAIVGWVSRLIIRKWSRMMDKTMDEIDMLADTTDRLNDFLANVSHEIRTPVNAVTGLAVVCIEKEKDPAVKRDLEMILDAGKRVGEQISDILDYSEIDRKNLMVNEEEYMIFSVVNDLVNELRPYYKKEVEVVIDVDPELPEMMKTDVTKLKKVLWHLIANGLKYTKAGGVYVRITEARQDQGTNLTIEVKDTGIGMTPDELDKVYESFYQADSGRARRTGGLGLGMSIVAGFVRSLGGFLTIRSTQGHGTTVRVSLPQTVVENGNCMTLNSPDKIVLGGFLHLDKYHHPGVRDYYNTMIRNLVQGLHITMHRVDTIENLKKLVPNLRMTHLFVGQEEYESDSEYMEELARTMVVAVVSDDSFAPRKNSGVRLIRKPFFSFQGVSILNTSVGEGVLRESRMYCRGVRALVVDDEPMNLMVAEGMFESYGMEVTRAESGYEAIRLCTEHEYDIIFMDHMMPEMDGIEAMKRIRTDLKRDHKETAIVALTANAVSSAKEMFLREGFDGFVSKPVDLVELERVMRRVLPNHMVTFEYKDEHGGTIEDVPENEEKDLFDKLRVLGVDTEKGLSYCQGDRAFYEKLLAEFANNSDKKTADLENYFLDKDWSNYAIRVHAIKSTSKMIGAATLSEVARRLEEAAKKEDLETLKKSHPQLMPMYRDILETLHVEAEEETSEDVFEFEPVGVEEASGDEEILEFSPAGSGTAVDAEGKEVDRS